MSSNYLRCTFCGMQVRMVPIDGTRWVAENHVQPASGFPGAPCPGSGRLADAIKERS